MLGKVVVITGATSEIGRIAAERLAAQGARIIIVARDQSRAERTVMGPTGARSYILQRPIHTRPATALLGLPLEDGTAE
jgi:NAD(P)-dependent dehydrogenase (short-subunit alcohol dehydrogenase family)